LNLKRHKLVFVLGGYHCVRCGNTDERVLQIDHIFGNGKEMPLTKSGIIDYYLENPGIASDELQILCANCNWIKRAENREVRH